MYNLLVSSNDKDWHGAPWQVELARCVQEYTDGDLARRFGSLDAASIGKLTRLPCIFCYEAFHDLAPKFGTIREIASRQGLVRIEYEIQSINPFLSASDLQNLNFELDIGKWELNRTHWAVKDVNLPRELKRVGITLPSWVQEVERSVDISTHSFDVALSFPGEARRLVEQVAMELEGRIGPHLYFYDNNYISQLARPSLDTLLQDIYRNRCKLVVAFLGADYQKKDWCGIEFRAIREIILERDNKRVMFIRTDDGAVDGVFKTDGYIDARSFDAATIAGFICQRLEIIG